jgi:hypothetical protein
MISRIKKLLNNNRRSKRAQLIQLGGMKWSDYVNKQNEELMSELKKTCILLGLNDRRGANCDMLVGYINSDKAKFTRGTGSVYLKKNEYLQELVEILKKDANPEPKSATEQAEIASNDASTSATTSANAASEASVAATAAVNANTNEEATAAAAASVVAAANATSEAAAALNASNLATQAAATTSDPVAQAAAVSAVEAANVAVANAVSASSAATDAAAVVEAKSGGRFYRSRY